MYRFILLNDFSYTINYFPRKILRPWIKNHFILIVKNWAEHSDVLSRKIWKEELTLSTEYFTTLRMISWTKKYLSGTIVLTIVRRIIGSEGFFFGNIGVQILQLGQIIYSIGQRSYSKIFWSKWLQHIHLTRLTIACKERIFFLDSSIHS